jgi:hypothetical protein
MTERLEAIAAEAQRILQKLEEHPFEQSFRQLLPPYNDVISQEE